VTSFSWPAGALLRGAVEEEGFQAHREADPGARVRGPVMLALEDQ
jgi:hypothetical protein